MLKLTNLKPDDPEVMKNPHLYYVDGEKVYECETLEDQMLFSTIDMNE